MKRNKITREGMLYQFEELIKAERRAQTEKELFLAKLLDWIAQR